MTLKRVVAAVIEQNGEFLLCRRNSNKIHGNLWEFPGGKIENGETHEEAITRELKEELGLQVTNFGGTICSLYDEQADSTIDFVRVSVSGELQLFEHSEARWVNKTSISPLDLAPSDHVVAGKLVNQIL